MIPITNQPVTSSLDLSFIKLNAQKKLFKLLDKYEGTKTIIWDDKLIGPFEFVASASLLRQHDVIRMSIISDLKAATATSSTDFILILLRKDYQLAKCLADTLSKTDRTIMAKTSLIFVPQRCASIEKLIEDRNVDLKKLYSIEQLDIELYHVDTDLLSMENEFVFRDIHVREDHSSVHQIVEGLIKLQHTLGQIPKISGQGKAAKLVCDLILKRRKLEPKSGNNPSVPSQISHLVLIDRKIDLLTPLLTQLTYEGLLDEVFGIKNGIISLPADKFTRPSESDDKKSPEPPKGTTKKLELKSSDELYSKLRDSHINVVSEILLQSAKDIKAGYDECNSKDKTIHEMSKIVKRAKHLRDAERSQWNQVVIKGLLNEQTDKPEFIHGLRIEHQLLQEDGTGKVVPGIDTKLLRQEDSLHVIRLICIQSIVNNGLKQRVLESYKREVIQNYGQDYLLHLMQLERADLLLAPERYYESGSFSQLKNRFNLIDDNCNERDPGNFSYVYGGYAPLSVMAVKMLCQFTQPSWKSISDTLKSLPEPTVTYSELATNQAQQQQFGDQQKSLQQSANYGGSLDIGAGLTGIPLAAASMLLSAGAAASSAAGLRVRRNSTHSSQSSNEDTKRVLVFFIGGCSFAEISALRYLAQQEENNCEFIIATTKVFNGKTFIRSLLETHRASNTIKS